MLRSAPAKPCYWPRPRCVCCEQSEIAPLSATVWHSHACATLEVSQVKAATQQAAEATKKGDRFAEGTNMGPLASKAQFERVQRLICRELKRAQKFDQRRLRRPEDF